MTPSDLASCLRTALAPRNRRHVEDNLRGGMLDASTRYERSGSNRPNDFHGDFMV
jgi:hypothetical protein